MNKWILVGFLGVVFLITLRFSYGPGYGGSLLAFLGANTSISPEVSPSDMVTPVVTSKKVVTSKSVTNVTTVSPVMSPQPKAGPPLEENSIPFVSPSMSPRVATMTPVPLVSPLVSPQPSASTGTASPTAIPESTTPSPTPIPTSTPIIIRAGDIVINEIGWMGTSANKTGSDEWVELFNNGSEDINLSGWILKSETDDSPHITLSGTILAHGYYLLERTDDTTISDIKANYFGSFGSGGLKNDGEILTLQDKSSNVIDRVDCSKGWFYGDNITKSSMERRDSNSSGSSLSNWATNNHLMRNGLDAVGNSINGTPGSANSVSGS